MKKIYAIVLALVTAGSLLACGGGGSASTTASGTTAAAAGTTAAGAASATKAAAGTTAAAAAAKLTSLKASGQPYAHTLPAWLAQKDGLFKQAGMDFDIVFFTGGAPQNEALGAGEWEVGTYGAPPAVTAGVHYGVHVIGFGAPDDKAVTIWARPDSDIAKITGKIDKYPNIKGDAASWKGKTVLCPTSTTAHFTLIATLKTMGLTTDDINLIDMSVPQAFTAFKAGQADIVCLWDPQGFAAADEGWTNLSSSEAVGVSLPTAIVASDDAVKNKHAEILEYMDAYLQESEKYSKDVNAYGQAMKDIGDENGVEQTLEAATKSAANRPLQTLDDEIKNFSGAKGQSKAYKAMMDLADFFAYTGTIEQADKTKLESSEFVDNQFIKELAKKYGKDFPEN